MKKIIALTLALVLCFGLCACGDGGNDKPKGIVAPEYVGEWIIMGGEYNEQGKTTSVSPVRLVLADDGTATYQDATGTWEYVESENLVYINGTEHDFTTNTPFSTVGALKELLRIYPDNTPLYVCGVGGVFCPNEEEQCILLEADSCRYEGIYGHCGDDGYLEF